MQYYKMNPQDIETLYLGEVLYYNAQIKQFKEEEQILEINRYKLLVSVIHGEPKEMLERLENVLKGEVFDNEVGDLKHIERFKDKERVR